MPTSPTIPAIRQAMADNAGYDGPGGSVGMARLFITACRQYLALAAASSTRQSTNHTLDLVRVEGLLNTAVAWAAARDTTAATPAAATVRGVDLSGFRDGVTA